MAQTTVCFVARADFESKPGGDTVQWRMYDTAAREAGLRTETWFDGSPMPAADVYHAMNILNPLDLHPKLVQVERGGGRFILSTIHHSHAWLLKFRRHEPPTGTLGRLLYRSPIGRSVPASETAREVATLIAGRRFGEIGHLRPRWGERVRWLLGRAERVALLSAREGESLRRDLRCEIPDAKVLIVPNWVEGIDEASTERPRLLEKFSEPPVLVVGRIEPRKNSLGICSLAQREERPTLFIGAPHPNEGRYVERFEETIRAGSHCRWIPGIPREALSGFYRHASFLLNASFLEVSPYVDIEALAFGCPVVTTRYAEHHELLPPSTPRCDPYEEASVVKWLHWRPGRLQPEHVVDRKAAKRALVKAYRDVAESKRRREA